MVALARKPTSRRQGIHETHPARPRRYGTPPRRRLTSSMRALRARSPVALDPRKLADRSITTMVVSLRDRRTVAVAAIDDDLRGRKAVRS
jgi:hypothetical protein